MALLAALLDANVLYPAGLRDFREPRAYTRSHLNAWVLSERYRCIDRTWIPLMIDRHPSVDPVHPGEILREDVLPALSMSTTAVADALKISRQTLYDILNEKQPVTAEMAVRFGKLFGNDPNLWINLQRAYDLAIAQRAVDVSGIPTLEVHPRQIAGSTRTPRSKSRFERMHCSRNTPSGGELTPLEKATGRRYGLAIDTSESCGSALQPYFT